MKNAKETLVEYINSLTDAQADRISEHMTILQQLARMTENETIFTETFLDGIFGKVTA